MKNYIDRKLSYYITAKIIPRKNQHAKMITWQMMKENKITKQGEKNHRELPKSCDNQCCGTGAGTGAGTGTAGTVSF
jgi:hypothetical protein